MADVKLTDRELRVTARPEAVDELEDRYDRLQSWASRHQPGMKLILDLLMDIRERLVRLEEADK